MRFVFFACCRDRIWQTDCQYEIPFLFTLKSFIPKNAQDKETRCDGQTLCKFTFESRTYFLRCNEARHDNRQIDDGGCDIGSRALCATETGTVLLREVDHNVRHSAIQDITPSWHPWMFISQQGSPTTYRPTTKSLSPSVDVETIHRIASLSLDC
jgi:hypothetical protein